MTHFLWYWIWQLELLEKKKKNQISCMSGLLWIIGTLFWKTYLLVVCPLMSLPPLYYKIYGLQNLWHSLGYKSAEFFNNMDPCNWFNIGMWRFSRNRNSTFFSSVSILTYSFTMEARNLSFTLISCFRGTRPTISPQLLMWMVFVLLIPFEWATRAYCGSMLFAG